jgi:hypothetical protein
VSRKKDQCAETLRDMRNEHASLEKQLKEKKKSLGDDGENLSEEEVMDKITQNYFEILPLLVKKC